MTTSFRTSYALYFICFSLELYYMRCDASSSISLSFWGIASWLGFTISFLLFRISFFLPKFDFHIFEFETEITHFPDRNSLPGVVRKRKISPKFGEIPLKLWTLTGWHGDAPATVYVEQPPFVACLQPAACLSINPVPDGRDKTIEKKAISNLSVCQRLFCLVGEKLLVLVL